MENQGQSRPLHQPLQRAQNLLLQARQFLCAGCKRDCQRRLTQFGAVPESCKHS